MEIWRDVEGYEGIFQVSNYGRVYSLRTHKILKQGTTKSGYKVVSSRIGGRKGKTICKRVHIWVANAFCENPENKLYVNHKDGDKTNNFNTNLEWVTASENSIHAFQTGLAIPLKGESSGRHKLKEQEVIEIFLSQSPYVQIARKFNTHRTTVGKIKRRERWSHVTNDF